MSSKYRRQLTPLEIEEELAPVNPENQEDQNTPAPVEHDWKKRHDDVRRYLNQVQSELKAEKERSEALAAEMATKVAPPENEAEFNEWLSRYPKLADMMAILARKEAKKIVDTATPETKKVVEDLEKFKLEREVEIAKAELAKLQPDFYTTIAPSEHFKDWIMNQAPEWARKALVSPDKPDAQLASDVIDLYKAKHPKANSRPTTDPREIASGTRESPSPVPRNTNKVRWSESKVSKLSQREYEKFEEEIHDAMASGNFDYDLSAAS